MLGNEELFRRSTLREEENFLVDNFGKQETFWCTDSADEKFLGVQLVTIIFLLPSHPPPRSRLQPGGVKFSLLTFALARNFFVCKVGNTKRGFFLDPFKTAECLYWPRSCGATSCRRDACKRF